MELKSYISSCEEHSDLFELTLSWHFAGTQICNKETAFYRKGALYLIQEEESSFNNYLVYCDEDYNEKIDWEGITTLNEANRTTLKNGLTAMCFTFFETTIDSTTVDVYLKGVASDYKPFNKYKEVSQSNDTDIIIDDTQYYQIMQVLGLPFIKESELEYNRQAILKLAVEPALKMYYAYFPLIQEEVRRHSSGNYMIPYPVEPYPAYKCVAWVTTAGPVGGGAMSINTMSPLTALCTDTSLYSRVGSGVTSRFNTGIQYNKPVPGWTGREDGGSQFDNLKTAWPITNTLKNMMRREKLSKVHIKGEGIFARGYSTMSGYLNIKWFCWSRDFDDVEFDDFSTVLRLCQAYAKLSIGSIRELLRTDSNLPFREGIAKEGEETIKEIEAAWKESPARLRNVTSRGGLVG